MSGDISIRIILCFPLLVATSFGLNLAEVGKLTYNKN